jgi:glucokinase
MEIIAVDIGGTHRASRSLIERGCALMTEPVTQRPRDHSSLQLAWQAFGTSRSAAPARARRRSSPRRSTMISSLTNNPDHPPRLIRERFSSSTSVTAGQ